MALLPPPLPLDNGHALSIVICAIIFPTLATLCVLGRLSARRMQKQRLGPDDYIVMLALAAVYGQMVIIIMSTIYGGVGHHIHELSDENLVIFFKLITAVQFTFGSSLGLAKISICFLLIRIFFMRNFKIAAWCVMVYCFCWMAMVILIGAGLCRPFAFNWDKSIKDGKCGNLDAAYISIAALDILGDSLIILLPMPWVWKLKVNIWSKIGLSIVFALAFLDIIIAILRIVYLVNTSFAPTADFTWASTGTYVWSVIEPSVAVIVASAGLLRPLFISCFPRFWSTVPSTKSTNTFIRSGRRNGLKYSRHREQDHSVMYENEFGDDDNESGCAVELAEAHFVLEDGKNNSGITQFVAPDATAPNTQYKGTVMVTGLPVRNDKGIVQKQSGEHLQQRETLDPHIINVENSYSITSIPKR